MEKTKVTALVSQKGGVGKSASTIMVANYLSAMGQSVLVVDTDFGNSATVSYLKNRNGMGSKGFASAVSGRNIADNILPSKRENIDILPSNKNIEQLNIKNPDTLLELFAAESEILAVYDHIIIDTAAGYNSITAAVIKAADLILTPIRLSRFDVNGCSMLFNKIGEMGKFNSWRLFFNDISHFALKAKSGYYYDKIKLFWDSFENCSDIFVPQTLTVAKAVDDGFLIKREKNEKLYEAVRSLAGLVNGEDAPEVEAF